ncbi:unnamed protein product [Staurois parvus]|uniref:Ataxin-3 n=1 Tax=Staurois parvus TaxID=386267 RepID=A0ABN9ETW5_9NEOB|nr:unnamed protein product [Staurois parvus]
MIQVQQMQRPRLIGEDLAVRNQRVQRSDEGTRLYDGSTTMMDEDEENLQKALALSRQQIDMEDEEADLRRAIQLSMHGGPRQNVTELASSSQPQTSEICRQESLTQEELRQRRQMYFEKQQQSKPELQESAERNSTTDSTNTNQDPAMNDEAMLRAAMKMSLDTGGTGPSPQEK